MGEKGILGIWIINSTLPARGDVLSFATMTYACDLNLCAQNTVPPSVEMACVSCCQVSSFAFGWIKTYLVWMGPVCRDSDHCMPALSSLLFTTLAIFVSSANVICIDFTFTSRSLRKMLNSVRPNIDLWGTPVETSSFDDSLLTTTLVSQLAHS